ncbi:transporter [Blastopirellula sp. JC732]|uniref:Transporter n=1 Tax=Blastopirellula sediminis TaxID=2894196 RepID=A0A9X1SHT6_9BACT|nr:transporter [Blastopirellula sediminis]MCC9606240.1 transporter [Blastopirellula sediminis]MCC9630462.1 transporter [Blastopirellula sediminis]
MLVRHARTLIAVAIAAACLVAARSSECVAQEYFESPSPLTLTPPQVAPEVVDETFLNEEAWFNASQPPPVDLSWSQRLARMTAGRTQLEGGYSYLKGRGGSQHALPDMLLRYGWTDRLEIRLGWPGIVFTDGESHVLDPSFGVVYDMWGQDGYRPQMAIHVAAPLTMQGNPFAINSFQPVTEVLYSWQVGPRSTVSGSTGFALFNAGGDHYTQLQQSLSYDYILTDRIGTFVSWDMLSNHGSAYDTDQHMLGGGFSYLLNERWVLSWRTAFGVSESAPDFVNDLRFAYRF